MKNLKIIFLLSFATLFIACEKDKTDLELPDIQVKYHLAGTDAEVELKQVRFLDENGIWQIVDSPALDWKYEMTVPRGFVAEIEMDGNIPEDSPMGTGAYIRADGSGQGSWGAVQYTQVKGDFTIKTSYQMGDAE